MDENFADMLKVILYRRIEALLGYNGRIPILENLIEDKIKRYLSNQDTFLDFSQSELEILHQLKTEPYIPIERGWKRVRVLGFSSPMIVTYGPYPTCRAIWESRSYIMRQFDEYICHTEPKITDCPFFDKLSHIYPFILAEKLNITLSNKQEVLL